MSNSSYEWLKESALGLVLSAVLSKGLGSIPRPVRRALQEDDPSRALAMANAAYADDGDPDRDAALTYAVLLVERGLVDEAMGVIRRALEAHAQDVGLQLAQVVALQSAGKGEQARSLLDALGEVSAVEPRQWRLMADTYLDLGAPQEAMSAYEAMLSQGGEDAEVAYRLAHLHEEEGNVDGAAHYQWLAANWAQDSAMMWEMAAELCYEVGRVEEAIEAYERLSDFQPHDPQTWFMLGLSQWYIDELEDAVRSFERVVDLHPMHQVAWRQLGSVYLELGRGEQALRAYEQALEIDDQDFDALLGATLAARDIGDIEEAMVWAERARAAAPEQVEARQLYALVTLDRGRSAEAAALLQELIEEEEGAASPQLRGALAVARMMEGDGAAAIEEMEVAVRRDVEPMWVLRFAEALMREQGVQATAAWLQDVELGTPGWPMLKALMAFSCAALVDDSQEADEALNRFAQALEHGEEALPVVWNLEAWEALSYRFEGKYQKPFDALLDMLEGRQDPSSDEVLKWTKRKA